LGIQEEKRMIMLKVGVKAREKFDEFARVAECDKCSVDPIELFRLSIGLMGEVV